MSSVVLERECLICACASFTSAPAIFTHWKRGFPVNIKVFPNKDLLGADAAVQAATAICYAIREHGSARIVAATGASQFEFLDELTKSTEIDWKSVELFHLDEYLQIPITHPASFRKYLIERLINKVGIVRHHLLDGEGPSQKVIDEATREIRKRGIDVAFVGIGENGHIAFNDPPADFQTEESYIVVELDEACRRQQLGEGWFRNLAEVPTRAISMTVRQILKSKEIICVVPDARKAQAVARCLQGEISPLAPASILQTHLNTSVYLDKDSSALLKRESHPGLCQESV
jgi:glucosamine-6-phosphate deaminase